MNPNNIFDYIVEGMKWLAIGGGIYITTTVGTTLTGRMFSEKIKSQEDLEKIVEEETEKLGVDKPLKSEFGDFPLAFAAKQRDGTYHLHVGRSTASRSLVKHELYHIHKGHKGISFSKDSRNTLGRILKYLFIEEPQAIAYGTFGLKL